MEAQQTKPEFREPNLDIVEVGDTFVWTHESNRAGCTYVSKEGTVVETHDKRIVVDVGSGNFYTISTVGTVKSISENHKQSLVGYCVYQ